MTWIIEGVDEDEFVRELHSHSDRAAGLLGHAIIDARLTKAIKSRWKDNGKILEELFNAGGPLGTFSARMKVGFAIQLYGLETYNDLNLINRIRNAFAHDLGARHFNVSSVRNRADGLIIPKRYPISTDPSLFASNTNHYIWDSAIEMTRHSFLQTEPSDARGKFLRSIEILAAFLWIEDYIARSPGIPQHSLPVPPRF